MKRYIVNYKDPSQKKMFQSWVTWVFAKNIKEGKILFKEEHPKAKCIKIKLA